MYVNKKGPPSEKNYRKLLISIIYQFAVSSLTKNIEESKIIEYFEMNFNAVSGINSAKLLLLLEDLPSYLNFGYI